MPQALLPIFPDGLTLINNIVGFQREKEKIFYFLGQAVLYQHEEKDEKSFRYITSQLVINGTVTQAEIVRALKVSPRSVQRYVKKMRKGGAEAIFAKKKARKATVFTPEVIEQIIKKTESGKTKSKIAKELNIKYDTLLKGIKRNNILLKKKLKFQN
jgi:DNA-binding CsgD family transcriptional regulator